MRQQRLAVDRQRRPARQPFEQRCTEFLLELADALGQRRLRHGDLLCRRRQATLVHDGEEMPEEMSVTKR